MKHKSQRVAAAPAGDAAPPRSRARDEEAARVEELRATWERHGRKDPFWAVLTDQGRGRGDWSLQEFFETGRDEIADLMQVLERFHIEPRQSALDFGCGLGRLTVALSSYYDAVAGVDISDEMISRARELTPGAARIQYQSNPRADLSLFVGNTFDLVHSSRVLQHMAPVLIRVYLREFYRVLRPRGILHFQLPTTPKMTPPGVALRMLPSVFANRLRRGMEMHGVDERVVARYLLGLGFELLEVRADGGAGPRWNSRRYTAVKQLA